MDSGRNERGQSDEEGDCCSCRRDRGAVAEVLPAVALLRLVGDVDGVAAVLVLEAGVLGSAAELGHDLAAVAAV